MAQYPHLFKVGHTTYAIIGVSLQTAYAYMREVMHCKPGQYKYLGPDRRTPKQQFESFTIGINASGFTPSKLLTIEEQEEERQYQEEKAARPKQPCPWCNGTGQA